MESGILFSCTGASLTQVEQAAARHNIGSAAVGDGILGLQHEGMCLQHLGESVYSSRG